MLQITKNAVAARDQNAWWCCKRSVITTSWGLRPPDPPHENYTNTVPLMTLENLPIKSGRRLYFLKVCFNQSYIQNTYAGIRKFFIFETLNLTVLLYSLLEHD